MPDRDKICELLEEPLKLFAELYTCIEPEYGELSNEIQTQPCRRRYFEKLSDIFYRELDAFYSSPAQYENALQKINSAIRDEPDLNILCLSLFKALGDYLALRHKAVWNRVGDGKRYGDIIITRKPQNPIYGYLKKPIRQSYGTPISDLTGCFGHFSFIRQPKAGIRLRCVAGDRLRRTNTYLKERLRERLRIGMTHFMCGIEFEFASLKEDWPENEKTPYNFLNIKTGEEARQALEALLLKCHEREIDILVLPELMIDWPLLEFLKEWLMLKNRDAVSSGRPGLIMVVAGSFHFEGDDGMYCNASTVLNHAGEVLWVQNKLKRFAFDRSDLRKSPELQTLCKTSEHGGYENILETSTVCFADTPLGRLIVSICIDHFHNKHTETYQNSGANVFFVPAMTPTNARFLISSGYFADANAASTFYSNSGFIAAKIEDCIDEKGSSFYYLPSNRNREPYETAWGVDDGLIVYDVVNKELIKEG